MVARLWNLLHDGVIVRIDGSAPGDLEIEVKARYLCEMFAGAGQGFVIQLRGCSLFKFTPWGLLTITELREIVEAGPQLVSAQDGDPLAVCCAEGVLHVRYQTEHLRLDSGELITLPEPEDACSRYSDRFKARQQVKLPAG